MAPKKKAVVEPDVNVPGIFNNILLIDGDPDVGRQIFEANCTACHALEGDAKAASAPPLGGVVGRAIGTTGFAYSKAFKAGGFTWSAKHLWGFLANPGKYVPGNKMAFAGIPNESDRANLIAYLVANS